MCGRSGRTGAHPVAAEPLGTVELQPPRTGPTIHAPIRRLFVAVLLGVLAVAACEAEPETEDPGETPEEATEGTPTPAATPTPEEDGDEDEGLGAYGVSAGDADAVEAGMSVLADGGNAVDAAVAAAYAVSVVEPFASGIGGGGAAIIVEPGEEPIAYDYREVVPEDGRIPASNTGTPGFVAGMETLVDSHGTRDHGELLGPAITLAEEGTDTSSLVAEQLAGAAHRLPTGDLPHLYPGGSPLSAGEPLVQEELAATLRTVADGGAAAFYEGELAERISTGIEGVDTTSLAAYEVQSTPPARGSFAGYEVVAAPPPLPGVALVQMLQVAEALGIAEHEPGSADFVHSLAMAWRLSEQFVNWDLGDPDYVDVPVDELTDPERNAALAEHISMDSVLQVDAGEPRGGLDAPNTTHLTVVDADGTLVSMTNTVTNFWGSGQYTAGFFLNDQLSRFDIGQSSANEPEAGRRSVSWSLPAVVLDGEGRPVLGLGSPGGKRIPKTLAHVIARWGAHGESLEAAVDAPRFHLEGSTLELERSLGNETDADLRRRGYSAVDTQRPALYFGSVQALELDHEVGEIVGSADPRREADWATDRP
jgi:gamma-glutamyltranspeptidase / glutathione hydrolase